MADPTQIGYFQILERIASGGMGTVYRALNTKDNREIALKVLRADRNDNPDFIRRFQREASVMAELKHPHIARVFAVGEVDEHYFIEMEYAPSSLYQEIKMLKREGKRMSIDHALDITKQISSALDFAHRRGLIHRDIKPSNILITHDGRYALTDFGIVWFSSATQLTKTAQVMGTPEYMSPEQCQAFQLDARSDLYSMGCVLYEMLCGEPPFTAEVPVAITLKQVQELPNTMTDVRSDVPMNISELLLKLLAKKPIMRVQTAAQLIQTIDRVQQNPAEEFKNTTIYGLFNNVTQTATKASPKILAAVFVGVLLPVLLVLWIGSGTAATQADPVPTIQAQPALDSVRPTQVSVPTETAVMQTATAPPTPKPTAAPTPLSKPELSVVNDVVNVRAGPGTDFEPLAQIQKGQTFGVVGKSQDNEWLQIMVNPATQKTGWVKMSFDGAALVQPNAEVARVPVVVVSTVIPPAVAAAVCPQPNAVGISSPAQGQVVRSQLVVVGNADVPVNGYAKVEIKQEGDWQFVSKFEDDRVNKELARLPARDFARLKQMNTLVRVVIVTALGQEMLRCQISVLVRN